MHSWLAQGIGSTNGGRYIAFVVGGQPCLHDAFQQGLALLVVGFHLLADAQPF
jgi:hypothetical protein